MTALKSRSGATGARKAAAKTSKVKAKPKAATAKTPAKAEAKRVVMRRVGGSLMAAMPADVVRDMGLAEGQTLVVAYDGARLILEPKAPPAPARYTLREILASCDFDLPRTAEEREWEAAPRVGREAL